MKVELTEDELIIRIPRKTPPQPSASGKTLLVASSHGNQRTAVMVDGEPMVCAVNAYIKAPKP